MNQTYSGLWNKYRPALLKLMMDASSGPQAYKLSSHEFRVLSPKEKGGYGFSLTVSKGKSQGKLQRSPVAKDLLSVLQMSGKATELMNENDYEFSMDKQFVLRITRKEEVVAPENVLAEG